MLSEHDVYGVALHPYDKQKYKQEYITAAKQEYITAAKQEYITAAKQEYITAKQEYITNAAKQEYISAKQHEYITSSNSVPKQSDYLVGSVGGGHLSGIGGGGGSGLGPPPPPSLTAGSLGGQPLTASGGLGSQLG